MLRTKPQLKRLDDLKLLKERAELAAANPVEYIMFSSSGTPGLITLPSLPVYGSSSRTTARLVRLFEPCGRSAPTVDEPPRFDGEPRRRRVQTVIEVYQFAFDGDGPAFDPQHPNAPHPGGPAFGPSPLDWIMVEIHDAVIRLMRVGELDTDDRLPRRPGADKEHAARDLAAALVVRYRYAATRHYIGGPHRAWRQYETDPATRSRSRHWDELARAAAHDAVDALLTGYATSEELLRAWLKHVWRGERWVVAVDDDGRYTVAGSSSDASTGAG